MVFARILKRSVILFSLFFLSVSLFSLFVSATADVGYIVQSHTDVKPEFISVFNELGKSYELIFERDFDSTNFSNYKMILFNDEYFTSWSKIPVNKHPAVIVGGRHMHQWNWTSRVSIASQHVLYEVGLNNDSDVSDGINKTIIVYNSTTPDVYYLDSRDRFRGMEIVAYNIHDSDDVVVGIARSGDVLTRGGRPDTLISANTCFFGIFESDYWTNSTRELFKNCVNFAMPECVVNSDCPSPQIGANYCSEEGVSRDVTSYSCVNTKCVASITTETVVDDCGSDSCDSYGSNYCKNGDVYQNRTCYDRGCLIGACFTNPFVEEQLVDNCTEDETCSGGQCVPKPILCYVNSDCGTDGWLNQEVCQSGNVSDSFRTFTCNNPGTTNSYCSNSTQLLRKENCSVGCVNGDCVGCLQNSDCGSSGITNLFCQNNNIWHNFLSKTCVNYTCTSNVIPQLNTTCLQNEVCSDGQCVPITCSTHSDCGTNGFTGINYCWNGNSYQNFISFSCHNAGTIQSSCSNFSLPILQDYCEGECISGECLTCFNDLSCGTNSFVGERYCEGTIGGEVLQNYQEFDCLNPGTAQSDCLSSVSPVSIENCTSQQACLSGQCVDITCFEDSECNDLNASTYDQCISPGSIDSFCRNTPLNCNTDADCGFTGFFGSEYCLSDNVFKNYQTAICQNPGTLDSYCLLSLTPELNISCGTDSCDSFEENYCQGEDVYHNRTCFDRGCSTGACFTTPFIDSVFVESCQYGCSAGECLPPPVVCGDFELVVSNLRNNTGIKPSCPESYWYYYDLTASAVDNNITLMSRQRTWLNGDTEAVQTDIMALFGTAVIPSGTNVTAFDRWFCTDFSPDVMTEALTGASEGCANVTKQYSIGIMPY